MANSATRTTRLKVLAYVLPRSFEGYLPYIIWFLVALFPWANPAVSHGGSTIYTTLALGGLIFGWTQYAEMGREERIVLFAYAGMLVVVGLSLVNAENWSDNIRYVERWLRIGGILPVCLLSRRCGHLPAKAFLAGCLVAAPLLATQAWYQVNIRELELARGAYHHILFGYLSALAVTVVLAGLLTLARTSWHYIAGLASLGAGIVAAAFSGGRNAWLYLVLLLLVVLWFYRNALGRKRLTWMAGAVAATIAAVVIWQPPIIVDRLVVGLDDLVVYWQDPSADTSLGNRINLWRNSLVIFSESPLFGTGLGDFQRDNRELVAKGLAYASTERFSHAHNVYLHALAEMGVIGLAALLLSLFVLPLRYFYASWRAAASRDTRFCALAGFLCVFAFAVFGIGEVWLVRNPPVNAYALSVAVFLAGVAATKNTSENTAAER